MCAFFTMCIGVEKDVVNALCDQLCILCSIIGWASIETCRQTISWWMKFEKNQVIVHLLLPLSFCWENVQSWKDCLRRESCCKIFCSKWWIWASPLIQGRGLEAPQRSSLCILQLVSALQSHQLVIWPCVPATTKWKSLQVLPLSECYVTQLFGLGIFLSLVILAVGDNGLGMTFLCARLMALHCWPSGWEMLDAEEHPS